MIVATAKANTVTLNTYGPVYPGLGGGEFTAYASQDYRSRYSGNALYNPSTGFNADRNSSGTGFETFCVETGVEFAPGTSYQYSLGLMSQPVPPSGAGSAVALTQGAAWLYFQFAHLGNSLANFSYGAGRQSDDNYLQAAIWAFQNNQSYTGYPVGGPGNKFYDEAITALGGTVNAEAAYTGSSVRILQMWQNSSMSDPGILGEYHDPTTGEYYWGAAQNQLVLTGDQGFSPVPDSGLTIGLLGMALSGLTFMRRKIRA
jgi:hypothetical protein